MCAGIRRWISTGFKTAEQLDAEQAEQIMRINETRALRGAKPLDLPTKAASEGEKKVVER